MVERKKGKSRPCVSAQDTVVRADTGATVWGDGYHASGAEYKEKQDKINTEQQLEAALKIIADLRQVTIALTTRIKDLESLLARPVVLQMPERKKWW